MLKGGYQLLDLTEFDVEYDVEEYEGTPLEVKGEKYFEAIKSNKPVIANLNTTLNRVILLKISL